MTATSDSGPAARRDPGVLLAVAAVTTAGLSLTSLWWALPAMAAAFFAGHRSGRTWPMAAALSVLVVAGAAAVVTLPTLLGLGTRFVALVVGAALLPWLAGRVWRQYQELVRAGWSRAEQLEREQRLVAEQARLRERARIAQDMHDALGHDLSLIALSAGALKLAPGLADAHRAAAEDVRARAATAVERLGEVIGILREEAQEAPAGPADFSIARLVEGANASGLETALHTGEEPGEVPAVVERAAHRVVQEALTNVAKHAPGASARVRVAHTATETVVTVENAPPPAGPAPAGPLHGGGRGLVGLDERVRLAGGTFTHGPRDDGGFTVTARLPHAPTRQPPAAAGLPAAPAALPPEHPPED
ncbi:histidine kinase, partial [Streptomyces cinnamoneus]|uniref:sensor histidine kinase n=1 Tax=Streptomyces cinnamoneus TaxID=53446 RepID=UPI00343AD5DF